MNNKKDRTANTVSNSVKCKIRGNQVEHSRLLILSVWVRIPLTPPNTKSLFSNSKDKELLTKLKLKIKTATVLMAAKLCGIIRTKR